MRFALVLTTDWIALRNLEVVVLSLLFENGDTFD